MALRSWKDHLPAGADPGSLDLTAGGSLPAVWAARWAADPDRPLLLDLAGRPDRWITAGELDDRTRAAAGRFATLGLRPGDRVLSHLAAGPAAAVAAVAVLRAGLVLVPANPDSADRELTDVIADVRPRALVTADPARVARLADGTGVPPAVLGPDLDPADGSPASVGDPGELPLDAPDPDRPALIGFTSGTTGSPKGAVLSQGNLLAGAEALRLAWGWEPDDRLVHGLPLFHAHGLCVGLFGTLLAGASAVLLPRFDPGAVLDAARDHRASLFFGVPTMYHRLFASGRAGELARLRLAVSGSAPLAAGLHRELADTAGVTVLERYGMTETLMNASNPLHGDRRAGTVGFPLPGVDIRIEGGGEDGGEVLLRGPNVFAGYWERPVATAEAFTDGWFRSGDLGAVDDAGYLRLLGRSKELIISGGFNVYPAEVEDVLLAHPAVAEVAVTGTPSEEWGEVVTAWVVPAGPPPSPGDLMAYAADRLAPYKRPRLVRFVDALPRNAMGKVQRGELQ